MVVSLITGIGGQDGTYLAEALIEAGHEVHGVARSVDADELPAEVRQAARLHEVDVADTAALDACITSVEPDLVFNLAAVSSVFRSWQQPVETARVNALAAAQVLDSAFRLQERTGREVRVVQASSAELFGDADTAPQDEGTRVEPVSPYGASKAFAHFMVKSYRSRGLFASNCVLYNHESPRRPETFVTRKITASAARISLGRQDRLSLGTIEPRRDWGWAPDYVRAMHLAATAESPSDYVIATGTTHSIADFVESAFARVGIADWRAYVDIDASFSRPADPTELRGDASKARAELGWAPTLDFDQIVSAMVDHDVALLDAG